MIRRVVIVLFAVSLVAVACSSKTGSSPTPGGLVNITLWQGYGRPGVPQGGVPNYEADSIDHLINQFNQTHPSIHVQDVYCCTNDQILQKLTVALQGGQEPDISYQYGTSMPQLSQVPQVVDLTHYTQDPAFGWSDFFPGVRGAATVGGKVLGIPALTDNLAIVYNKALFNKAGVAYPTADWTWDDFRAAAKALTNPAIKQYGWEFPADASEDTVWHYDAMLWEAGGDILNADNTQAAFDSPAGLTALTALQQMAVTDKSVWLDQQNTGLQEELFNSGKIGMMVTGPWDLSSFPAVNYGVQIMPEFPGGNHQSISGPDMWVVFNKSDARVAASVTFLHWLTDTQQQKYEDMYCGHLPTRSTTLALPGFIQAFGKKFKGNDVFAANLANVQKARPVLQTYDAISQAMGQMVVAVMLGKKDPKSALDETANTVNGILAGQ
jgi:multiple sugar transport system substrate-binding protein